MMISQYLSVKTALSCRENDTFSSTILRLTVSSVILEEINTLDLASNLICATNSDNELVCVETSFTN